jgi:galactoside O-acetyltransferase
LSPEELTAAGFRSVGHNCQVSRFARFYGASAIVLGDCVRVDDFAIVSAKEEVILGDHVHIAPFCLLMGRSGIVMDSFSGLASRVAVYSESDDPSGRSLVNPTVPRRYKPRYHAGRVRIGRHCGVGTGSTLLPNAVLEEGAIIAAHSLLLSRARAWSIYSGIPARRRRERSRMVLELEASLLETERGLDP